MEPGEDPRLPPSPHQPPPPSLPQHLLSGGNEGSSSTSSLEGAAGIQPPPPAPPPTQVTTSPVRQPPRWEADSELLAQITALGFAPVAAEKALFYTSNASADAAVGWILDNPDAADDPRPLVFEGFSSSGEESDDEALPIASANLLPAERAAMTGISHKMVHVVNGSLGMGLGKVAAQVGHGSLGLYRDLAGKRGLTAALNAWEANGGRQVVLKAESEAQMHSLVAAAKEAGIPSHSVRDAGLTQIPSGSFTVLSFFADEKRLDPITGGLKLLD